MSEAQDTAVHTESDALDQQKQPLLSLYVRSRIFCTDLEDSGG